MHVFLSCFLLLASATAQYLIESSSFGHKDKSVFPALSVQRGRAHASEEYPRTITVSQAGIYLEMEVRCLNWYVHRIHRTSRSALG